MDNAETFSIAMHVAAIFALAKTGLHVFFPTFAGLVWQTILAPMLVPRWPSFAQSDDQARYSYLPAEPVLVYRFGLFPAPIGKLATGLRDGFLIGVLFVLFPPFIPIIRLFMIAWVIHRIWLISRCSSNAARLDETVETVHGLLLFLVAQEAVAIVGGQHGLPTTWSPSEMDFAQIP